MNSFKNDVDFRSEKMVVIGKALFELRSQSYGRIKSGTPMFIRFFDKRLSSFLIEFNKKTYELLLFDEDLLIFG